MSQPNFHISADELERQREAIRRGLARANVAAVIIVTVVLALAVTALVAAYWSDRNAHQAQAASDRAQAELWKSYLAQARAVRLSELPGRRREGLKAVAAAARIRPSLELRNEAIALLALTDLDEQPKFWPQPPGTFGYDFDQDLERYVRADDQGAVHIHRLSDNQKLMSLTGPKSPALVRRFSPDGRYLAIRCLNGELWIWDLNQSETTLRAALSNDEWDGWGLAISADSRLLAVSEHHAGRVRVFELATGRELKRLNVPSPRRVAFHSTQPELAVLHSEDQTVSLLNWETGNPRARQSIAGSADSMAWNSDGRFVALGCRNGEIVLWDVISQKVATLIGHKGLVCGVTFNPAGTFLVSYSWDRTTRLWEIASGRSLLATPRGFGCQFSRDGQRLGFAQENMGVGFWQVSGGDAYRVLHCPGGQNMIFNADFSPDELFLAASKSDGVYVLNTSTGRLVEHLSLPPRWFCPVFFLRDGGSLVSSGKEGLSVWPIKTITASDPPGLQFGDRRLIRMPGNLEPFGLKISADDRCALAVLGNTQAILLDLKTGQPSAACTNVPAVSYCALSPDGQWQALGTGRGNGTRLCRAQTGEVVRQLDNRDACVEFSPDGKWLVAGHQDDYDIWDTRQWQRRHSLPRNAADPVGPVAFARDGAWMVIKRSEQHVEIVDPATAASLANFESPGRLGINNIAVSADGTYIALSGNDEVQLWNLRRIGDELATLGLGWGEGGPRPEVQALKSTDRAPATLASRPTGSAWISYRQLVSVTLVGAALAMGVAWAVFRRHRQLIHGYAKIETMVEQRSHQLELARTEIMHSQKMKALGTLAAGIAHDFNNLLSVIRMSTELIEEAKTAEEIRENAAEIEQAVQQGKSIVRSMLGYSREPAGDGGRYLAVEVVQDLLRLLSKEFLSGLSLTLDLDPNLPPVSSDRNRLEQVLLNLVVNAAEAMKGTGELRITLRRQTGADHAYILRPRAADRYLEVLVADSGPGIEPELLARIFEPFFTTKIRGTNRGTGLGLSTVYTIAEKDGLGISVESAPGKGAAFRITIPAA